MTENLVSIPNPFSDAAVGSVWDNDSIDVPRIHAGVSAALSQMIDERARGYHHRCVMLYGDAGSGKTHVMRRLRLALERDLSRIVPFSWVRMQTSPLMMWRHVRRTLADDLTRKPFRGSTQLAHIVAAGAEKIDAVESRDLAMVLEHLAKGQFRRDARAWLAGDTLPESALAAMGLAPPDSEEEAAEDESRRIVFALAAFLAPSPVVLCLDQLEALQSHPGDKNGLFAIGKLVAALHDDARNVVAVGCVQSGLMGELAAALSRAEQDRYRAEALRALTGEQVRALVKARLDASPELARLRPANAHEFWPIDLSRLDPLAAAREGVTARKVIFECEQMFRAAQNLKPDTTPLEVRLEEKYADRVARAARELTPDTSTNVLSDALPRFLYLRGIRTTREDLPKWVDHVSVGPGGRRRAVVLANEEPARLWRKLDRVSREWIQADHDVVIVRDGLNPLPRTAPGSHRRFDELQRRGARIVNPSREALIALDAARRLLSDVESGELTYRGDKIPVATVEDWVRHHLSEPVSRLIDEIAGEQGGPEPDGLRIEMAAYLAERKVAAVEEIARDLRCAAARVEDCANQNPDQFGLLAGTAPVVFERIPAEQGA